MDEHTHQWRTRIDSKRQGYGLTCNCGEWLPYESVASYLNRLENNVQTKTWCVRDASDTWHLVTGVTGAMADPYVAQTACGKVQGVSQQDWGALRMANCKKCIET